MITWEGCDGELYSANAKCKVCGKACGSHFPSGSSAPVRKPMETHALGKAVKVAQGLFPPDAKLHVVITRGYSRTELDGDNTAGACKGLRDEIARHLLGRDDAERFGTKWEPKQDKVPFHKIEIYEVK